MLSISLDAESWRRVFRRNLFSWEEGEVSRLHNTLRNAPPLNQNRKDGLHWIHDPSYNFSVRSLYNQWEVAFLPKPEPLDIFGDMQPTKGAVLWLVGILGKNKNS